MLGYDCESILKGLWVFKRVKAGYMSKKYFFLLTQQLGRVVLSILDDMSITHYGTTISHCLNQHIYLWTRPRDPGGT